MRVVIQRVKSASVLINGSVYSQINKGLMILVGVGENDDKNDILYLVDKIVNLRIFPDEDGNMNISVKDINGELLVVSNFTLYGDCRRGRRPSFSSAKKPEEAKPFYNDFLDQLKKSNLKICSGEFQAMMEVELINSGPVTILLDSKKEF